MCVTTRNSLETIFQYHFWSSILMCQIHMLCINSDRYTSGGHVSIDLQSKAKHIPGVTSVYFTSHRKLMPSLIMAFVTYILLAALHTRLRNSNCLKMQVRITLLHLCGMRNGSRSQRGASRSFERFQIWLEHYALIKWSLSTHPTHCRVHSTCCESVWGPAWVSKVIHTNYGNNPNPKLNNILLHNISFSVTRHSDGS